MSSTVWYRCHGPKETSLHSLLGLVHCYLDTAGNLEVLSILADWHSLGVAGPWMMASPGTFDGANQLGTWIRLSFSNGELTSLALIRPSGVLLE